MRRHSLVLLALVATSCADTPPPWQGSIDFQDGVRVVTNPTTPLATEQSTTINELWSYSGPDAGNIWFEPNAVSVGSEAVYVVDQAASQVHFVGLDGQPLGSVGRPGGGPGEYRRIVAAIPTAAGVFVVDGGNTRVDVLASSQATLASHRIDGVVFEALPWGEGEILAMGMSGDAFAATVFTVDGPGAAQPIASWDPTGATDDAVCARRSTMGRRHVLVRCSHPVVRVYSTDGVLEEEFVIPLPPEFATEQEVRAQANAVRESLTSRGAPPAMVEQLAASVLNASREKPSVRKIAIDPDGLMAIWMQNPDDFGGGPATLHLLTREGVYLDAIEFEDQWIDFEMRSGVIYCLTPDPTTGLVTLRALEVSLSSALLDRPAAIE